MLTFYADEVHIYLLLGLCSLSLVGIIYFMLLKCCFTSTETIGLLGTGAQDGHLNFHTAPELWFYFKQMIS